LESTECEEEWYYWTFSKGYVSQQRGKTWAGAREPFPFLCGLGALPPAQPNLNVKRDFCAECFKWIVFYQT
jgi:hypothetical protein